MPSKEDFSDERIQKMLEESRMKQVPPQVLKGFKESVMRRIESEAPRRKPASGFGSGPGGRWFAAGFRLPRINMTVGTGALACLILASVAALTLDRSHAPAPSVNESLIIASAPVAPAASGSSPSSRAFDTMSAAPQLQTQARTQVSALARKPALTVEEELRLIEEFDDRRFFIRQDITLDELASA